MEKKKVKIRLMKSLIGHKPKIRATVRALGLKRINQIKEHTLNPQIQGMINKVDFLVQTVEEKLDNE